MAKEFEHLKIRLEEIKSATNNFSDTYAVGSGGFGRVYKGRLLFPEGGRSMVAIKRLDNNRLGLGDHEFLNEIAMLSSCKHENIVSLIGFCDEGGEKILVYEYASRGSLDRHLGSPVLTWTQRINICLDAAMGLRYLHDGMGTKQTIIHRDIRSSNILLDDNWNAKLSDFGLSGANQQQNVDFLTHHVGTHGYIDPEFYRTGVLNKESDVYSFGVILFEVLCGRLCYHKIYNQPKILLPMWKESCKQNRLQDVILDDLKPQIPQNSLDAFTEIAYQCLHESRKERPTMQQIVQELERALGYQELYAKEYKRRIMIAADFPPRFDYEDSETYWEQKLPSDYEDTIKRSKHSLQWKTNKELYSILRKGFLNSYGEEWFYLAKDGKKCLMLPARAALEEDRWDWKPEPETRFEEVADCIFDTFGIFYKFNSKMLSPQTTYAAFLVYELPDDYESVDLPPSVQVVDEDLKVVYDIFLRTPQTRVISWNGKEEKTFNPSSRPQIKGLPKQRSDGWMEVKVHEFHTRAIVKMISTRLKFSSNMSLKGLIVQGIDFRPV